MAELSAKSGVSVATIKYYLREGLLPAGERTSPNQANYGEEHVRRLKLVRALLDIGGLSIATSHAVLSAIDEGAQLHDILGLAQQGLPTRKAELDAESWEAAAAWLRPVAEQLDWLVSKENPAVESLLGILQTIAELGFTELLDAFPRYAELADRMSKIDLDVIEELPNPESIVEGAVVGTVLGDAMFMALRRLAQQRESARRFTS